MKTNTRFITHLDFQQYENVDWFKNKSYACLPKKRMVLKIPLGNRYQDVYGSTCKIPVLLCDAIEYLVDYC